MRRARRCVAALFALGVLLPAVSGADPDSRAWQTAQRLTFDAARSLTTYNFARDIAAQDGGGVQVVWYDDRDGSFQIYLRRSLDRGATWLAEQRLSAGFELAEHPAIASSGETVLVVWHGRLAGAPLGVGPSDIFLRRSLDGGRSWGATQPLSTSHAAAHASIALSGGMAQVVWGESSSGFAEIVTRHSSDHGASWGAARQLSSGSGAASWVPTVEIAGRAVHVAWVDTRDGNEEEYYRRSPDAGRSWEPARRLTRHPANSWAPSLAIAGDVVQLVWFDQRDNPFQPRAAESELDGILAHMGLPFLPEPSGVLVPHPEEEARRRAAEKVRLIEAAAPGWVAAGGDADRLRAILEQVHWLGLSGATYLRKERKLDEALRLLGLEYSLHLFPDMPLIYYGDAMALRVADKLLQISEAAPGWVAAGGDPSALEAGLQAFQQHLDQAFRGWEIYARRSQDGGRTWGPTHRLTDAPGLSQRPSVVAEGDRMAVAWFDGRDGNLEIYAKRSYDRGRTWEADERLTEAPGESRHVSVAAAGGEFYAVWCDERDGNPEIYFMRLGR